MRKQKPARRKRAPRRRELRWVPPEWAWHYRTLVALRDYLIGEQLARSAGTSPGNQADPGSDRFDREFIRTLLAHEPDALGEISAAIARILFGSYGRCEATGRKIPAEKLRAAPWIRHLGKARKASGAKTSPRG